MPLRRSIPPLSEANSTFSFPPSFLSIADFGRRRPDTQRHGTRNAFCGGFVRTETGAPQCHRLCFRILRIAGPPCGEDAFGEPFVLIARRNELGRHARCRPGMPRPGSDHAILPTVHPGPREAPQPEIPGASFTFRVPASPKSSFATRTVASSGAGNFLSIIAACVIGCGAGGMARLAQLPVCGGTRGGAHFVGYTVRITRQSCSQQPRTNRSNRAAAALNASRSGCASRTRSMVAARVMSPPTLTSSPNRPLSGPCLSG